MPPDIRADATLREATTGAGAFLAYARPQRFSIARLDICRVLNDAALLLRNSSEVHEGHVIDVQVPPSEVAFEADENQIRQIVWNLATNGLRAMPMGGRLKDNEIADLAAWVTMGAPWPEAAAAVQPEVNAPIDPNRRQFWRQAATVAPGARSRVPRHGPPWEEVPCPALLLMPLSLQAPVP